MKQQNSLPIIETKFIGDTLRFLKTTAQRNNYLMQLVKQKEKQKLKDERLLLQSKQKILQHTKKKFLSLLKSRNNELSFLKFRPIQKPINLLRMCAELKISDRISKSVEFDEVIESKPSSKSNRTKRSSSQIFDYSVHVNQNKDESTPKQRGTLQFLSSQQQIKMNVPTQQKVEKKSNPTSVHTHSLRQQIKLRRLPLNQLESKLEHLKSHSQDSILKTGILCRVPSQILTRNGILLPTQKDQLKIIKRKECLDDDNSSLASHTELKLDSIYNNSKHLKQDHKNYEHKKEEYQQESIKLFYKKIYCKI
ncbi:unnamed protein product [Paramecium primaurelia]|uniref:Uncharacterized protein n=1 Tax=Paramecium primaurelia TaxID=5886 RepID=A0A8S1KVS9_PARPR|nr:unnamed protein product [Paramecium primaurelia]